MKKILLLLLLSANFSAFAAGRMFYDGFESGTSTMHWTQDGSNNRCDVVTTAADGLAGTHAGTYMARCNWESDGNSAGVGTQTAMILNDIAPYTNEVMYRFWIRRDASLNGGSGPKICRFGNSATFLDMSVDNNPTDGSITGAFSGYNTSNEVWLGTYWGDISHAGDRAWHKIEIYIYEHASNGIIRLWEDDVLQKEVTGYTLTQSGFYSYTPSWTTFLMGSNWSASEGCCAHDAVNYLYWDEFEIYTDAGTGGIGSMSDGTMTQGGGSPPVANFTCTPLTLQAPASTTCTDSSTNTPTSWSWSGDCGTSTSQNPVLSCTSGGLKDICLIATNGDGSSSQFCRTNYVTSRYRKPTSKPKRYE